jgi:hypothetical protein
MMTEVSKHSFYSSHFSAYLVVHSVIAKALVLIHHTCSFRYCIIAVFLDDMNLTEDVI